MFVTNWISTTKIQKISEITNFFRHYFLSRTEVNRFDSQHYNENDTPSNLFEEEIRKSQINKYSRFPKCFYPKYSRFPKCLVKTEEKYTDEPNTSRPSLGICYMLNINY